MLQRDRIHIDYVMIRIKKTSWVPNCKYNQVKVTKQLEKRQFQRSN